MADLRIVDAPEIPTENITGEEKLPTGGNGNYSISLDSLADYTKTKKDLADNTSVDGKVNSVRQELDAHIEDLLNPHQVTKGQIGLGNVDNTADADKPVSNSTQAAIISAVAPKANKADVYTKSETYTKQESSDLVNSSISTALTPVNTSLELAKRGIANRYDPLFTYNSGERAVLTNGDIVKSTINGNTNDPNVDVTGWVKDNSASQIFDESGLNQQQINNKFKLWFATIEDFGADVSKTALENSIAINNALQNAMHVYFPNGKTYQVDFDLINARSDQLIYGGAILQGQQTQTTGADGRGVFLKMQNIDNTTVEGITIKNGFRGRGIECTNSRNIRFKDVTLDGFTYCMWVGEQRLSDTDVRGCQNIWIDDCSFLNARYWNLYIRGSAIDVEEYKTQKVWVTNPYVYNASMAGIVLAEGHVKQVVIENPVFKRCNLCMHFELATDVTVINPRDEDTGKKPDHQTPNTEYPYEGWGIYTAFAHRIKIKGGALTTTCYHFATAEQPSSYIEYEGFTGYDFVYEAGSTVDSAKNIFQNYTFNNVTVVSRLVWQNPGASHYLRDFSYNNCRVLSGVNRNAMNAPRTVNLKVSGCRMANSYVTIGNEGVSSFTNNIVTNNAAVISTFNGVDLTAIFEFTGNTFINTVSNIGNQVFTLSNFGVLNYDNTVDCNSAYSAVVSNVSLLTWGLRPHIKLRSATPYSTTSVTLIQSAQRPYAVASYTGAALATATNAVNTTDKYFGKEVYNSTTAKFMKALGSPATSGWVQVDDNSVSITPV